MIKKILGFLPGGPSKKKRYALNIILDHHIATEDISIHALKVLNRLNSEGHQAYLVGGGVRDLLLGIHPKDFDIATSAHPETVRSIFRNSRLIGRRFKLVHVLFGREIIEVATFRGSGDATGQEKSPHRKSSAEGLILRDNIYGTREEDAIRRDFTINALYYCAEDNAIYDYTGGVEDIQRKQLRLIGEPRERYQEDPVRMLRALRFASKLGFQIERKTAAPIKELAPLLASIPAARLFDEVLKLFLHGHAQTVYQKLRETTLFASLFPDLDVLLNDTANPSKDDGEDEGNEIGAQAGPSQLRCSAATNERFLRQAFRNTDARVAEQKSVTPAFLFACLLWPLVKQRWLAKIDQGIPPFPALQSASAYVVARQCKSVQIPKRFTFNMKEIWDLQLRLDKRHGRRAQEMLNHPRFRAAFDFLLLREEAGEIPTGLGQWWTDYQGANEEGKEQLVRALTPANKPKRRRPRKRPPVRREQ